RPSRFPYTTLFRSDPGDGGCRRLRNPAEVAPGAHSRQHAVGTEECSDHSAGLNVLKQSSAVNGREAAVGGGESEDHLQCRRLAGSVGAEETRDLPWRDVEADIIDDAVAAVALRQLPNRDAPITQWQYVHIAI